MKAYILASAVISPQPTHRSESFPDEVVSSVTSRLSCIEPDYKDLINPVLLRRMPRILKMGLAASQLCISRSGIKEPDGIIIGTGLGCLDNLEKFLLEMIDKDERITTVLPFINSTHNAVAAQVSMMLKNHNYSTTYCHRAFSFESALRDAMMLIEERKDSNVLIGGIDECTTDFILLHSYLNAWKPPVNNLELLSDRNRGTIAGEGAAYFMLSGNEGPVSIRGVHTFLTTGRPGAEALKDEAMKFLDETGTDPEEVVCVMAGFSGDPVHDSNYLDLLESFRNRPVIFWKHLCGEYYTTGAFATWLASAIITGQKIPDNVRYNTERAGSLNCVLIYNQAESSEHSFILLQKN